MSLQEFQDYVANSGVIFDELSTNERGEWRERFDKSRGEQHYNSSVWAHLIAQPQFFFWQ